MKVESIKLPQVIDFHTANAFLHVGRLGTLQRFGRMVAYRNPADQKSFEVTAIVYNPIRKQYGLINDVVYQGVNIPDTITWVDDHNHAREWFAVQNLPEAAILAILVQLRQFALQYHEPFPCDEKHEFFTGAYDVRWQPIYTHDDIVIFGGHKGFVLPKEHKVVCENGVYNLECGQDPRRFVLYPSPGEDTMDMLDLHLKCELVPKR